MADAALAQSARRIEIHHGDCLHHLRTLPSDSLDSLVTDPPAGISFMGKEWDGDKGGRNLWVAWMTEVMTECLRVLKPGAHGLVWALPRTSHWTATALENAGFEVRDVITHLFGTGFPKSLDISKAIDKAAGAEREAVGVNPSSRPNSKLKGHKGFDAGLGEGESAGVQMLTAPATDAAKQWQGWGTALKPASEHWILVRKPLGEKTVAANVLKYGTGGLNIDGCRVPSADPVWSIPDDTKPRTSSMAFEHKTGANSDSMIKNRAGAQGSSLGRFPANLVLSHNEDCGHQRYRCDDCDYEAHIDELRGGCPNCEVTMVPADDWRCTEGCAVRMLDEQSGTLVSKWGRSKDKARRGNLLPGLNEQGNCEDFIGDSGGASRFFYVAKASKGDRNRKVKHER